MLGKETHQVVEDMKRFDLNKYEAETYVKLLHLGEATASDIAESSTVPKSRIYDILSSIESKGMVTKQEKSPRVYTATAPQRVLEHLIYRIEKQHEERISSLRGQIENIAAQLPSKRPDTGDDSVSVWQVQGMYAIACKLIEQMQNVTESMYISGDSPFVELKSRTAFDNQIEDRDISIQAVGVFDKDSINEMKRHGGEVRCKEGVAETFFIFDQQTLLKLLGTGSDTSHAILTNDSEMIQTYLNQFGRSWAQASKSQQTAGND
jgi:sugar-specific transcriptional regulator TrmB